MFQNAFAHLASSNDLSAFVLIKPMVWPRTLQSQISPTFSHFITFNLFFLFSIWSSDLGLWVSLLFCLTTWIHNTWHSYPSFYRNFWEGFCWMTDIIYYGWTDILAWVNEKCPGWVLIWSTEFLYRSRGESSKTHLSCFDTVRPRAYFYCVHLGEIRQGIIPSNEICSLQTSFSLVTRSHCALSEIHFEGNSVTCLQCAN